jgi:hypothetical protein
MFVADGRAAGSLYPPDSNIVGIGQMDGPDNILQLICDQPDAWRREPFHTDVKKLARIVAGWARVIVSAGDRKFVVANSSWGSRNHNNEGLQLTAEQVADRILGLESSEPRDLGGRSSIKYRVLDPACFASDGGPSLAERFGDKGLYFTSAKNSRTTRGTTLGGWDMLRHRLDGEERRRMIYFFDTCVDSIRTIPALQRDPSRPEDVDTEAEDHAGDETRYAVMSRPWVKRGHTVPEPALSEANEFGTIKINLDELFTMNRAGRRQTFRIPRIWGPRFMQHGRDMENNREWLQAVRARLADMKSDTIISPDRNADRLPRRQSRVADAALPEAQVTVGVTVMDAAALSRLAAKLDNGRVSSADLRVAGQLTTELVDRLHVNFC